ncbi:hypothetical protein C8R48DRAFT_680288 [Suillus tomentosus]|nr:hypothetical protein C8R48DRAFT_680288 [Suillus tomentosus]
MQALHAWSQTNFYKTKPGKVPKNNFGNINLYIPLMLPEGSVHMNRRAIPIIEGIVVAEENKIIIVEGYLEAKNDAEEKAHAKCLDQVHKHWIHFMQGLEIVSASNLHPIWTTQHWICRMLRHIKASKKVPLTTGDDIVKPFHLPKDQHTVLPLSLHSSAGDDDTGINEAVPERSGVAVSYTHPHDSPFIPPEMCRWERYPLTCLLGGVMQCLSQCMSWPKTT